MDIEAMDQFETVIGVVSDTHIPDRVYELHPDLLSELREQGVQLILHAGDISSQWTLDQLAAVAQVEAVRGNRDIITPFNLPAARQLTLHGEKIFLSHGHGNIAHYLWDKWIYILQGYEFGRYQRYLAKIAPGYKVIVFGHTHRPENRLVADTLYFNPGSAGPNYEQRQPSFGTLHFGQDGQVYGKIHLLKDYTVKNHRWIMD
ncbi:MAG: metallophosphoesterase family protein [Anaerolineaceae bacterium]